MVGIWGGTREPLNTKDWKPELLGAWGRRRVKEEGMWQLRLKR